MSEPLLPCPFCGSSLITVVYIPDGRRAHCRGCGAAGSAEFNGPQGMPNAEARATAMWNMRAATPPAAPEAEDVGFDAAQGNAHEVFDAWIRRYPKHGNTINMGEAKSLIDGIAAALRAASGRARDEEGEQHD
jgi:ABC-type sugar transport system substrate-binding protein